MYAYVYMYIYTYMIAVLDHCISPSSGPPAPGWTQVIEMYLEAQIEICEDLRFFVRS
jgi:hypothetical protein